MQFDVRTTGSDSNGGAFKLGAAGIDYSQQNAAQKSGTDLVIHASDNTKVLPTSAGVSANDVGNTIQITAGSGFTARFYEIISQDGTYWTLDQAAGTIGSTGGTYAMGGSLLTISKAAGAYLAGNTIWVKSGTYTLTSTITFATSGGALTPITVEGYNSTHGDLGTYPEITSSTNSVNLITYNMSAAYITFRNLKLTHTAGTKGHGFTGSATVPSGYIAIDRCNVDGVQRGFNSATRPASNLFISNSIFQNCVDYGIANEGNTHIISSVIYNNGSVGFYYNSGNTTRIVITRSVIAKNAAQGILDNNTVRSNSLFIDSCVIEGNGSDAIKSAETTGTLSIVCQNTIIYNNNGYAVNCAAATEAIFWKNNALGANASGSYANFTKTGTDISLSGDPFVAKGTGKNWGLNNTAGAGAACRSAGFPGAMIEITTTGYLDIGVAQHQEVAGSVRTVGIKTGGRL